MAAPAAAFKLYRLFTALRQKRRRREKCPDDEGREADMVGLSIAIFVALFGWGATYFGWSDPHGKIQLALATAFILGNVCGYKSKG